MIWNAELASFKRNSGRGINLRIDLNISELTETTPKEWFSVYQNQLQKHGRISPLINFSLKEPPIVHCKAKHD